MEVLLRGDKVVGLKVYGTLNKACQEKILSTVDIEKAKELASNL